jgi:hypothetical protein
MTISAKYIGQSTVQISTQFTPTAGASTLTTFMTFANTVADAILDTAAGATGALGGVTFTAAAGVTPQTNNGWTLFDSFWGGQDDLAGTQSPIYTQVFRCINKDGLTYKNAVLRYNLKRLTVNITCFEYWDNPTNYRAPSPVAVTSHTGVSEAYTYMDCAPIGFNLTSCDFIVNFSPRWGVIHSYINNESSLWAGIFETAREDVMDTAAANYPCWGFVSSTLWALGAPTAGGSGKPLNGGDYTLICMPKTRQGYTGINAAKGWGADYGSTFMPNWLSTSVNAFIWYLGNQANKFVSNGWDSTRRLTLPIKPISDFTGTIVNYGQIYGLKVLAPIGQNMNKITIPCDSDGNASGTGTDRSHWLLNNHHKTASTDNTSWFANTSWTNEVYAFGGRPDAVCYTGIAIYAILAGGASVVRYRLDTKTVSTVASGGGYTDIEFDGERYVYFTSSTVGISLSRLDTATDTTLVTFSSVGYSAIGINGGTVVCSPSTASNTPIFYRFVAQASTGTVNPITAASPATVTCPILPGSEVQIIRDIKSDFEGNFLATPIPVAPTNFRIIKIPYAGGAPTLFTGLQTVGIPANVNLQILDGNNAISWQAVTSGLIYQTQFNPRTGALIAATSIGTATALTANTALTAFKCQGSLIMIPRNTVVGNNWFITSVGKTATTTLAAPVLMIDQGTTMTFATANCIAFFDGSRIYVSVDTGLRVYSNVNGGISVGGNPTGAITLGQVAIPA